MISFRLNGQPFEVTPPHQFSGGERHVQLPEVIEGDLDINANVTNANDLIDLVLYLNALYQSFREVNVRVQIPYMPYARQDRVCAVGQAFSLDAVIDMIMNANPLAELYTWDLHSDAMEWAFEENVPQSKFLNVSSFLRTKLFNTRHILVQPDKGAKDRCDELQQNTPFFIGERVTGSKVRDPKTGWITEYAITGANVRGKDCFIADDICDGGATFNILAKSLKEKGAKSVVLFVTHGIFSKGVDELYENIDDIYTTNSRENRHLPASRIIHFDLFGDEDED